ncbi:MAG: hypothetical protein AAB556_01720 [Patescibacteria group bacterium]
MRSEIEKCVICGADTPYYKDTPPEQREYYENGKQSCSECANKKD